MFFIDTFVKFKEKGGLINSFTFAQSYVIVIPWVVRLYVDYLVQVDKHGITILYHLHQCRPCTLRDILC